MNFIFGINYFYAKIYLTNLNNSSKYIRINAIVKEVLVNSKYLKICL